VCGRADGGVAQGGFQTGIAVARADRLGLSSTVVVAGADADPCGEMADAGEAGKVDAELGDDDGGGQPVDAGRRVVKSATWSL